MEYCYFRISGRVVYNYLWKKEESKGMITSELRRVVTLSVVEGNVTREEALGLLRLWFVESWSVFLFFELCIIDNFGVHFSNFLKLLFSYSVVCDSATPWTAARQASLSFTISWSLLNLMSIESVMPSNHLILCRPLLLPSVFPSVRVFSTELALCLRWPKYCLDSWHLHFYFLLTFKNPWSEFYVKLSQLSCEGQAFAVCFCLQLVLKRRQSSSWRPRAGRGDKRRLQAENDWGEWLGQNDWGLGLSQASFLEFFHLTFLRKMVFKEGLKFPLHSFPLRWGHSPRHMWPPFSWNLITDTPAMHFSPQVFLWLQSIRPWFVASSVLLKTLCNILDVYPPIILKTRFNVPRI